MKRSCVRAFSAFIALVFAALPVVSRAAEIKVLATIAVQSVMEDLAPKFAQDSGHKVSMTFGLGGALAKRIQEGEVADLLIGPRGPLDGLIKAGRLQAGSDVTIAHSRVGLAVRQGTPKPDISSPDALKRTLIAAKTVSYSNPVFGGASGVHFAKVIERLGIASEMKDKTRFPPEGGFTARLLVTGEAELAVQQIGELLSVPGVELVGPLPGELQSVTTFAAAIPSAALQPEAARALIRYLQSPHATAVLKAKGLDPAGALQ
jgi:molybdate transport system substrate-binding protein